MTIRPYRLNETHIVEATHGCPSVLKHDEPLSDGSFRCRICGLNTPKALNKHTTSPVLAVSEVEPWWFTLTMIVIGFGIIFGICLVLARLTTGSWWE